jgi:hypothetical protein
VRLGVNLPWLDYGGDFGANAWHPEGGIACLAKRERMSQILEELETLGLAELRLFVFCDGRTGLLEDAEGTLRGVDPAAYDDMDVACELAREHGIGLVPVLFDFKLFDPPSLVGRVSMGGRRHLVATEDGRRGLFDRVLVPFIGRYAHEPAVVAWDLFNEPEWAVLGMGGRLGRGATIAAFRAFLEEAVLRLRRVASQPLTVGLASAAGLDLVRGLDFGFHQVHWYDSMEARSPLGRPVADLGCELPVILGEFPTRGSARSVEGILETANAAGYAGAWAWSWCATDEATDPFVGAERVARWGGEVPTGRQP